MLKTKSPQVSSVAADAAAPSGAARSPRRGIFGIGTKGAGAVLAVAVMALGCAQPAYQEPQGSATSKLLKAHASTSLPASNGADFAADQGGPTIDIQGWDGYVAGTTAGALFELELSAIAGTKSAGGLSIAFVRGADGSGGLANQLAGASNLQIRFKDGSGIVSSHDFVAGTSDPAHHANERSDALLRRAYSDAEALLRLPVDQAGGGDKAAACMASFLATVSASARCVDDASNTDDCDAVRNEAVLVAGSCNGPATANVLAGTSTVRTQALGGGAGGLGSIFKLLGSFALGGGKGGKGGGLGSFASILGGLLGGGKGGKGGGLGSLTGILGGLLGGGGKGGPLGALGGLLGGGGSKGFANLGNGFGPRAFDSRIFGGNGFDVTDFGNEDLMMGDFGDVTGAGLF